MKLSKEPATSLIVLLPRGCTELALSMAKLVTITEK